MLQACLGLEFHHLFFMVGISVLRSVMLIPGLAQEQVV